jgi:hypothetical protein
MEETRANLEPAVLEYLLDDGARAVDRAAAAMAVGHPAAVAACGLASDLTSALKWAARAAGPERTLAVLQALAYYDESGSEPAPATRGTVELTLGRAPSPN